MITFVISCANNQNWLQTQNLKKKKNMFSNCLVFLNLLHNLLK